MAGSLLQLFPIETRAFWSRVAEDAQQIQEIRLRIKLPVIVYRNGIELFLDKTGNYTQEIGQAVRTSEAELEQLLQHICSYSVYAYADELRQGFITAAGGHRIGVAGQVVLEKEDSLRTIKHISCLNIRVAHQVKGAADGVLPFLYEGEELLNTLIISPPGCGKTTMLRDLIRQISDGNIYGYGRSVGVVDERSEIAGCFQGQPQNDVGIRTDVLDACPKTLGMMLLLRAMSPRVIAIDELSGGKELKALRLAASCGCRLVATVHGEGFQDIFRKEGMREALEQELFQRFLILGREKGRCVVKHIFGREEGRGDRSASSAGKFVCDSRLYGTGTVVQAAVCAAHPPYQTAGRDDRNDDE